MMTNTPNDIIAIEREFVSSVSDRINYRSLTLSKKEAFTLMVRSAEYSNNDTSVTTVMMDMISHLMTLTVLSCSLEVRWREYPGVESLIYQLVLKYQIDEKNHGLTIKNISGG